MHSSIRVVALTLRGAVVGAGVVAAIGFGRDDNDPTTQPAAVTSDESIELITSSGQFEAGHYNNRALQQSTDRLG
jgi:hypothetical protein